MIILKKYWTDKFEEWYGGKPENYIGDSDFWKKTTIMVYQN
ncbi:hypothetical protein [Empedobacter tilapiae]